MLPHSQQPPIQPPMMMDGYQNMPQNPQIIIQDSLGTITPSLQIPIPPQTILKADAPIDISNLPILSSNDHVNKEKERIAGRLTGFNPKDNDVWRQITSRFGANIKQPELLSIAKVLAQNANLKLDRDAKRRKSVLIKWFDENWNLIAPFIDYVVLEDIHTIQQ